MLLNAIINGILVTYRDVTREAQLINDIEQNASLLEALVECSPVISVFALDKDFKYIAFNEVHAESIKRIHGVDIDLDMCMLDVIQPEGRVRTAEKYNRVLSGQHVRDEGTFGAKYKETWESYYSPILSNKTRTVIGLCCFGTKKDA